MSPKAPAKKAGSKKATATKKATPKKATPKKPSGVVKKKTADKPASAVKKPAKAAKKLTPAERTRSKPATLPTSTRATRSKDPKPPPRAGETPYHPNKDVSRDLQLLHPISAEIEKRAAELYRLYGRAAIDAGGDDQTVLLNACLDFAFKEDPRSLTADGWRTNDDLEHRYGMVDDHHRGNAVYWMRQSGPMKEAIRPLIGKSQTDRMKAFYALPSHLKSVDALVRATQEERERWRELRELAVHYLNHPDEGNKITKMRLEQEPTTVAATSPEKENKTSANEAPAKKTPAKKTPAKNSTSATVKKSASKPKSTSSSKAGVVKKKKKITRTPATQEETMNPTHPLAAILERGIEEFKRLHR
jgi:hypothetical protein